MRGPSQSLKLSGQNILQDLGLLLYERPPSLYSNVGEEGRNGTDPHPITHMKTPGDTPLQVNFIITHL